VPQHAQGSDDAQEAPGEVTLEANVTGDRE
jgi:hypothetical protein